MKKRKKQKKNERKDKERKQEDNIRKTVKEIQLINEVNIKVYEVEKNENLQERKLRKK